MAKETKYILLWPSLIGMVTLNILLAIMFASYADIAESCNLLDLKNGASLFFDSSNMFYIQFIVL